MQHHSSESTSRAGVHAVGLLVAAQLGWIFREQPTSDYGIDAQIETAEADGSLKGRLLGVQIKSGTSFFGESNSFGWVFRGEKKHLHYWLRHVLPVIVVLHNPDTGATYWEAVTSETVTETGAGWKLTVPRNQQIDQAALTKLRELTETAKEPHQRRLAQLLLEKPLMDVIASGKRLLLSVEEWVNKTSGRGSLRLFAVGDNGEEDVVKDWPFVFFGLQDYPSVLQELFPWAELSIDEDFYDDYDSERFDEECGIWDGEDHRYIGHWADYDEWKSGLPTIRPYEVASGEVAFYRLDVSLNELGRAFLTLEPFLTEGTMPINEWCQKCGDRLNEDLYCSRCSANDEAASLSQND